MRCVDGGWWDGWMKDDIKADAEGRSLVSGNVVGVVGFCL